MTRMPTLFIPHGGGPCFFMAWDPPDTWSAMADYLRRVPLDIGQRPAAIIIVSGHWEEAKITVQSNQAPPLLYDYYGFPEHTYEIEYPAPGSPDLALRVTNLLSANDIECNLNSERGFDHGVFIPLKLAFPDADIPVVQLSLRNNFDPASHIAVGEALAPLRDEGVLILGSGMSYHNMKQLMSNMQSGGGSSDAEAETFDKWLTAAVTEPSHLERNQKLTNWGQAPCAREAHPRAEHLVPLHVVAGAAGEDVGRKMLTDTVLGAVQSAYQFG